MRPAALMLAGLVTVLAVSAAHARPVIEISQAVVRATGPHAPSTAAYMTITNHSGEPDRLTGAACDCAAEVEMHISQMAGGVASMRPETSVEIPAHASVTFKPDGLHLMVMGLKHPLADGSLQPFILTFQHAGAVRAAFHVRAQVPTGAMQGMSGMGSMPGMDMGH